MAKTFHPINFIKDKQTVKFKQTDCQSGNSLTQYFRETLAGIIIGLQGFLASIQILIPIIGNINANVRECVFVSKRN